MAMVLAGLLVYIYCLITAIFLKKIPWLWLVIEPLVVSINLKIHYCIAEKKRKKYYEKL